uniref:Uncharacterized protein n=1 Tax=Anguilla anguilla TaxID=7936 RepID=A0A0E9TQW1_ANGAN
MSCLRCLTVPSKSEKFPEKSRGREGGRSDLKLFSAEEGTGLLPVLIPSR